MTNLSIIITATEEVVFLRLFIYLFLCEQLNSKILIKGISLPILQLIQSIWVFKGHKVTKRSKSFWDIIPDKIDTERSNCCHFLDEHWLQMINLWAFYIKGQCHWKVKNMFWTDWIFGSCVRHQVAPRTSALFFTTKKSHLEMPKTKTNTTVWHKSEIERKNLTLKGQKSRSLQIITCKRGYVLGNLAPLAGVCTLLF